MYMLLGGLIMMDFSWTAVEVLKLYKTKKVTHRGFSHRVKLGLHVNILFNKSRIDIFDIYALLNITTYTMNVECLFLHILIFPIGNLSVSPV